MTAVELFLSVVDALERQRIAYVTVGSFAANVYMDPRSTKDADFVLSLEEPQFSLMIRELGADFLLDPQMSLESVTLSTRYKLTHRSSSFEIEFFSLTDDAHDQIRFARRRVQVVEGRSINLLTAEDVVVTKTRWLHRAHRVKDKVDAINVLAVQSGKLDYTYIRQWCDLHGTRELFEKLYEESKQFEM